MTEHAPKHHEREPDHHESAASHEHAPKHEKSAEAYESERQDLIEQAQNVIKQEAVSNEDLPVEKPHEAPKQLFVNQELKSISFQRILTRTRKQLSRPERSLSRLVHQPAVDKVSQVGEKTIARPSGLLTGGLFALVGSSIMLFMAKHYGFRYNLFVFIVLFVAGFFVGLLVELLLSFTRKSGNSAH